MPVHTAKMCEAIETSHAEAFGKQSSTRYRGTRRAIQVHTSIFWTRLHYRSLQQEYLQRVCNFAGLARVHELSAISRERDDRLADLRRYTCCNPRGGLCSNLFKGICKSVEGLLRDAPRFLPILPNLSGHLCKHLVNPMGLHGQALGSYHCRGPQICEFVQSGFWSICSPSLAMSGAGICQSLLCLCMWAKK